jgi:hypothetical protein
MEGLIYAATVISGFCLAACVLHLVFAFFLYLIYRHDGGRMKFSKYIKAM